ncbi:ATP-dependent DNA helicase UvrD [Paenibacillus swuensis]|uniref:DNA 3'-5' helicase n=1 Tax=Paenibacillus swuensis TaxID=1178515 RepID=A0A172THL4_9BACL|nr:UvrD-helicase domain-containing protein [Paenibacillus swuensis]ANE46357.1 ATP-dependent DNA helicase UvrD [Paenibacillus swuensis]
MTIEPVYYKTPFGSEIKHVPYAPIAGGETSRELVPDTAQDAYYFRSLEDRGICLNAPQIEAVRHHQGPLLTLAGAGSGKTSVLVARTGYLLTLHRVAPENILLVTFTKKASMEMQERIARLPGISRSIANRVQASTFHAFFLKLIRHKGHAQDILGADRYKQIVVKKILRDLQLHDSYQPEDVLAQLSAHKMNGLKPDQWPDRTPEEREINQIFARYEQWKQQYNKIDYDDILVIAHDMLQEKPELLAGLQKRFTYVMVDEFQDTNYLQYQLVQMLVRKSRNLFVVGDDDQTIYTFNGARSEFILEFGQTFPGARTVTLDINYRSTSSIVGLGNEVIRHNQKRKVKTLKAVHTSDFTPQFFTPATTDEEAEQIIRQIQTEVTAGNRSYKDMAILHRTVSNSRAVFEQLALQNIPFIPYSMGDQTFYEHWIVKPVIDHLRLAAEPRQFDAMEAAVHALFIPKDKGMDYIWQQEKLQRKKYPLIHLNTYPELKSFQKDKVKERVKLIKSLATIKPTVAVKKIRAEFYDQFLEATDRQAVTSHKETIKETLDELEASAKRFETAADFIAFVDGMIAKHKEIEQLHQQHDADAVSLMTIHRSKGLEFPVVFLIGASEGILPHSTALLEAQKAEAGRSPSDRGKKAARPPARAAGSAPANADDGEAALEEERRLAYVAITRAKEQLYIASPAWYRGKKTEVSRFLRDAFAAARPAGAAAAATAAQSKRPRGEAAASLPKARAISPAAPSPKPTPAAARAGEVTSREMTLAWLCTDTNCKAWSKIISYDDANQSEKSCPLCGAAMRRGSKEVQTRIQPQYY